MVRTGLEDSAGGFSFRKLSAQREMDAACVRRVGEKRSSYANLKERTPG
jgi:hypothetical protein